MADPSALRTPLRDVVVDMISGAVNEEKVNSADDLSAVSSRDDAIQEVNQQLKSLIATISNQQALLLSLGSKVPALETAQPQLSQGKSNKINNNPAEVNLVNVSPEGDEWISSPGYDQRMVGNVLLLVTRGFEFILYTLLLFTGAIHSLLVTFVFWRCCRPSFTRNSPLRLKAFSKSNLNRSFIGWPKRLLIFSAVMLHNSAASKLSALP